MKNPFSNKLLKYARYLNHLRAQKAGKKVFYAFLYYFFIPCLKVLAWLLRPVLGHFRREPLDLLIVGECLQNYDSTRQIWDLLGKKSIRMKFVSHPGKVKYFRYAFLSGLTPAYPSELYLHASYAKYLAAKYQPRIACLFASSDVFPSLLRAELRNSGKTVFIPHAIIAGTELYSSFDFDYYFVFGESSLRNILRNPLRIGSTKAIKTGPLTFKADYQLQAAPPSHKLLYFSNWLVGRNKEYTEDFLIVADWAKAHPEFQLNIKLHPLEKNDYVINYCRTIPNMTVLPQTTGMKEALEPVSMVIVSFSNAALEAAFMNRPVVIANHFPYDPDSSDLKKSDRFLYLEEFFPPRANSPEQLHKRIMEVTQQYAYYSNRCHDFVNYHCTAIENPAQETAEILWKLLEGVVDFQYTEINECMNSIDPTAKC